GPDGIITNFAGRGTPPDGIGDGGPATQAALVNPERLAIGQDGSLHIVENGRHRVRKVLPDGSITTVAGSGLCWSFPTGAGGPPAQAQLDAPYGVALSAEGSLLVTELNGYRLRGVGPVLPPFTGSNLDIASEDGALLYQFDPNGRHLRTLSTLTGAAIHQF